MRHMKSGRKLNRNATHRRALMRNLTIALVEHGSITTTVAKAKELRGYVERLVTLGKKALALKEGGSTAESIAKRRLAVSRMGGNRDVVAKLFDIYAPRFKDRPGGYTRVLKMSKRRLGDGGLQAVISFMAEGETKRKKREAAAPVRPATA